MWALRRRSPLSLIALTLIGSGLALTLVVAGLFAIGAGGGGRGQHSAEHAADAPPPTGPSPLGSTRWRMATFNVLGSGHTDGPGADATGFESADVRMGYTVKILQRQDLSVVGFQEMRLDQYDEFNRLTGTKWDVWPDRPTNTTVFAQRHIANSLAWRTDLWEPTRREFETHRYINDDSTVNYPVVWLRNKVTGETVIAANFHNVSDKFNREISGGAQARRNEEVAAEITLANRLTAENPDVPIFFTGDFNERETAFCKIVAQTPLRAANGGWATATKCHPPAPLPGMNTIPVDWVFGSAPATLLGYTRYRDALVQKTTDHPVVISNVSVPPAPAITSPIRNVVVLSVEGLTTSSLVKLGNAGAPTFMQLRAAGSSTLDARTVERTTSLSNVASIFTGRAVATDIGGHGVIDGTRATTVHQTAGEYVAGVFDLVHNNGLSTSLFTSDPDAAIFNRSWGTTYGGDDPVWTNDGRDKISKFVYSSDPKALGTAIRNQLETSPTSYLYGQLSGPDIAGHRYGFGSAEYLAAVRQTDTQLKGLWGTIRRSERLNGRTLLIVTSEHGGYGRNHTDASRLQNVRIPFLVWGPGVPAGQSLYAMNPDYRNPGTALSPYTGWQPIRTSFAANLALEVLRLPAVLGSTMNTQQNFNIFGAR
jgi:hypothetical protein